MAKTLKLLNNKIRIKYLVRYKRYFLFYGNSQIMVNGYYPGSFETFEIAEEYGNTLQRKYNNDYTL